MSWNFVVPKLAFQKEFICRLMKPFELIELFKPFEPLNLLPHHINHRATFLFIEKGIYV